MIVYEPPGELKLPRSARIRKRELAAFLAAATGRIRLAGAVSVLITGDAAIRKLNRQFRKKDKATDVLSFPSGIESGTAPNPIAGDLAISLETAWRQAAEQGHPLETELRILLLHGLLHLAGYDHEADDGQMRRRERRLRREFGLPQGLIERADEPVLPMRSRKATPRGSSRPQPARKGAARL